MTEASSTIEARHVARIAELPFLSVIVPCRNEEGYIGPCLASILRNTYPAERYEILVVDGMSTDGTRSIVQQLAHSCRIIRLLDNPRKITPSGLNIGIRAAKGEIICRVDAHARISTDYLRRCVGQLCAGAAENIGGSMRTIPSRRNVMGRSIALCMSHKFGVGNSAFRTGLDQPAFTDTVFGGCYRRETLERIGLYNENLPRTQDFELNQRLRKSGGRILLDPAIRCEYFASPNLGSFARQNLRDGIWSILPFIYSKMAPVRGRHLISLAFVSAVIALAIGGFWLRHLWFLLAIQLMCYMTASLAFSIQICRRERDCGLLFTMPLIFLVRHFAYGFGSVIAVLVLPGKLAFAHRTASAG
jgi:succinoglycan biosynthesis protein ExoA